jgi:hypothetical protein
MHSKPPLLPASARQALEFDQDALPQLPAIILHGGSFNRNNLDAGNDTAGIAFELRQDGGYLAFCFGGRVFWSDDWHACVPLDLSKPGRPSHFPGYWLWALRGLPWRPVTWRDPLLVVVAGDSNLVDARLCVNSYCKK